MEFASEDSNVDPLALAEWAVALRFDYEVNGEPLMLSWPVTRSTAMSIQNAMSELEPSSNMLLSFSVNRSRRDVWVYLQRVAECMLLFDYGSSAGLPTILLEWTDEDENLDEDSEPPQDLYPLAAIGYRGSRHSDPGSKWLALTGCDADEISALVLDLEDANGPKLFLAFEDDDGEMRFIRRSDIAFVDVARLEYDEEGEPRFAAEN